jgi:predicted nucleotidyltransferase
MRNCFRKKVAEWVKPEATKQETLNVVNELIRSHKDILELYQEAREDRDIDAAIRALSEERRHLELVAKLTGQLQEQPGAHIDIMMNPEFVKLTGVIMETLEPEARVRLSERLMSEDNGNKDGNNN